MDQVFFFEILLHDHPMMIYHLCLMALYFKVEGDLIIFFGDTFNHRPRIKELGARYNGIDKTWVVSDSDDMRKRAAQIAKAHGVAVEPSPDSPSPDKTIEPKIVKTYDLSPKQSNFEIAPSMGLTISQLMTEADKIISQGFPTPIWIIGEIQSLAKRASGAMFFDFADAKSGSHQTATMTVKCNIWQNTFSWMEKRHGKEKIQEVFVDGNRLRALAHVKLYKDRGQISLTIEDVDPTFTQGALALARIELLKKLRAQGLDRKNKLLAMPSFPFKVALITAENSRAHTDFCDQLLSSKLFPGEIYLIPCTMQGDQVPKDVVKSLQIAANYQADVIVLSRGGGSAADLRWFDGEEIAQAIAYCSIPVIAAIGHHDDMCIAEEIAHTREKTPTAAADRILEIFRDTRSAINEKAHYLATALDREIAGFQRLQSDRRERLNHAVEVYFNRLKEELSGYTHQLQRSFDECYVRQRSKLTLTYTQIVHLAHTAIQKHSDEILKREQQLIRLDPSPWLESGWTQLSFNGKNIKSIKDVSVNDKLQARLRDGLLELAVTNLTEKQPKQS